MVRYWSGNEFGVSHFNSSRQYLATSSRRPSHQAPRGTLQRDKSVSSRSASNGDRVHVSEALPQEADDVSASQAQIPIRNLRTDTPTPSCSHPVASSCQESLAWLECCEHGQAAQNNCRSMRDRDLHGWTVLLVSFVGPDNPGPAAQRAFQTLCRLRPYIRRFPGKR